MEQIFYDLHYGLPRLAPGSKEETLKAFNLIPIKNKDLNILDLGCGTGMQTINLAEVVQGKITAIDNHQPFLDELCQKALEQDLDRKIETKLADMKSLTEPENYYDIIWLEGAIYIIGMIKGLQELRKFLKPKGYMAFTDMVWLKSNPPQELKEFWEREYPDLLSLESNLELIKSYDYKLVKYFFYLRNLG